MINLLEGMRVVDFASHFMGPIAGRILADWGAEVIKVEPAVKYTRNPSEADGDRIRGTAMARGVMNGDPCCNEFINGNKKSVAIDTYSPEGVKILQKLCASADVVITHLRSKDVKKFGIDYDSLSKVNPGIIVANTSGYGLHGADATRGGFDSVAYASRSGMVKDATSNGEPFIPFMGYGDIPAGTYLATAILAAYSHKQATGKGEELNVSLYGSAIWTAGIPIMTSGYGDKYPTTRDDVFPTNKMFKCADGKYIYVMGSAWEVVLEDLPKIMDFPKDAAKRWPSYFPARAASVEITAILDEQFAKHDREYWLKQLAKTRIPFDVVASFVDIQKDPQAWDNKFLVKSATSPEYPTGVPTPPGQFRFAGEQEDVRDSLVGDSTREQLKLIGYTDEQIDKLRAKSIVSEGDQFQPDRFNALKPGTAYNMVFSALGAF